MPYYEAGVKIGEYLLGPDFEGQLPWGYVDNRPYLRALHGLGLCYMRKGDDKKEWTTRDLSDKKYVYFWVDGIYFNARLDNEKSCILVIMGADKYGNKELIAVSDGYRESKLSWREILLDLKRRGLKISPKLAIGDGALGFWAAIDEVFPETKRQRCWVHKTANILDKLPKSVQPKAKSLIHEMYMAPTKEVAIKAYEHFIEVYEAKYPKAVKTLVKDKADLFNFYDFPAKHWIIYERQIR